MNANKLSITAKKLEVFFKILQKVVSVGMIVVMVALMAATIANTVDSNVVIGTGITHWDIGNLALELSDEYTPDNGSMLRFLWICSILGLLFAALVYIGFGYIRKILKYMAEGKPFQTEISGHLKSLAYLCLGMGVVQNIGMVVETTYAISFLRLDKLVESGIVRSVTANYTLELSFVVVFFVLLLMSYIFSYGTELQKLSDETL